MKMKPFSTYPEDRAKMLELCKIIEGSYSKSDRLENAAVELADLVKAILEDEQVAIEAGGNQPSAFNISSPNRRIETPRWKAKE
jgi:hypothetical protein